MRSLVAAILLFLIAASPVWALTGAQPPGRIEAAGVDTNVAWQIHENGYLRTVVTNYGYVGNRGGRLRDSSGAVVPVMESPPHSRIEYIYEAALWIGGVVGGDTLVSTGSFESGNAAHELYANDDSAGVRTDFVGDDEHTFEYNDTTIEPETVRDDPYDGPHRPLNVRVIQKTYTLAAAQIHSALFVDLMVKNTGEQTIHDMWTGWMIDPDIGHENRRNYWLDDITGHVTDSAGTSAAWAMDNADDRVDDGRYEGNSATRILGSMYLDGAPRLASESYNWWVPATAKNRKEWDWGPQRFPGDTNVIGGRGAALTDRFRYRLLANCEIDYAQPYAAVDQALTGWMPPTADSIARRYADGYDIRFLHSVGPVTLVPGDSVVLHWVWCLADNPRARVRNVAAAFDPSRPESFVHGLGLESLVAELTRLRTAWQNHFASAPIAPPEAFRVSNWNDTTCTLAWRPRHTERLNGYQITRSVAPRRNEPEATFWVARPESTFVDMGLDPGQGYAYRIGCVGGLGQSGGLVGPLSESINLISDIPQAPGRPSLFPYAYDMLVSPDETDDTTRIASYRVYRRDSVTNWELRGQFVPGETYRDGGLERVTVYEYRLTAVSERGYESVPGPMESAAVFPFGRPPLILDFTPLDFSSLTDGTASADAWMRMFREADYLDVSDPRCVTLADLSVHPVVFIISDGRSPLPAYLLPLLDVYTKSLGTALISGRDLFNIGPVLDEFVELDSSSVGYKAGIRRAYYPRVLLANPTRMNAEFVGAEPAVEQLPPVDVDSFKTNWGINAALPPVGDAIPFVGYFEVDTSKSEILYTFVSSDEESALHGQAVAVRPTIGFRRLAVFAFPLSYMEESQARECVLRTLTRIGYGMDRTTTSILIDYLYRGGVLDDERSADANRDGRVDVRDVVKQIGLELQRPERH